MAGFSSSSWAGSDLKCGDASVADSPLRPKPPRFARIPLNVLLDPDLTLSDLRLYGVMASMSIDSNIIQLGQRKLAEISGLHRRTVRRCIERLGAKGHISRAIHLWSHRAVYQLNSPVFLATIRQLRGTPERPLLGAPERPRSIREGRSRPPDAHSTVQ